MEYKVKG